MNNVKNKFTSALALIMGAAMIMCGAGISSCAETAEDNQTGSSSADNTAATSSAVSDKSETSDFDISKDETVYAMTYSDGSVRQVIVSDWLENLSNASEITDLSSLSNIQNVHGDSEPAKDGDNLIWAADGDDVYYKGYSDRDLPVDISITYTLDGKAVSADELEGQSGNVTICFDYTNNQYQNKDIDGDSEKIYVPFAAISALILDNDNFFNVQVTNGRLINDGERYVVMGVALPGLKEDLKLDSDVIDIPDYFEISADVTDFSVPSTYTVVTNEIFNKTDFNEVDGFDDLTGAMSDLSDAMTQLIDGSGDLYDGLSELYDKSGELKDGADAVASGASQIADGANQLSSGVTSVAGGANDIADGADTIADGAGQLSSGLNELKSNSDSLVSGAKQVFLALLKTADEQLAAAGVTADSLTIDNYADVLDDLGASLSRADIYNMAYNKARSSAGEAVSAKKDTIEAAVTSAVKNQVRQAVIEQVIASSPALSASGLTADQYDQAVASGIIPAKVQTAVNSYTDAQMSTDEIKNTIEEKTDEKIDEIVTDNIESDEVQSQIDSAVDEAASGASQLSELKTQLDSYNKFYQGLISYTNGVSQAADGAASINEGAASLSDGASTLSSGVHTLSDGAGQLSAAADKLADGAGDLSDGCGDLIDGVGQLKDGSKDLMDGLNEFNEKGIQKLIDAFDGDLDGLVTRLRAIEDVSKDYTSFAGINDGMDGTVRFVYRTDAIE